MGYRIKRKERVAKGIRRIVREQLRSAIKAARDRDGAQEERVHEVRTRLKRSRAALAMIRQPVGRRVDDDAPAARHGRRLAKPRDWRSRRTRSGCWARACRVAPAAAAGPACARRERTAPPRAAPEAGRARAAPHGEAAARAARRPGSWEVDHGRRGIGKGVTRRTERRGARWRDACSRPSPERLHDWRKQVKALSYELRIIAGAVPELATTLVPKVERLAEILGQVHDLDCAKATVALHPRWFGPEPTAWR